MTEYTGIAFSSKCGPVMDNPWIGAVFTVNEPWPKFAHIQSYDAPPRDVDGCMEIRVSNGWAKYRVINKDEWGGFDCAYIDGEFTAPA